METVEAAQDGLISRLVDLLFKAFDSLIDADNDDLGITREPIKKDGKVGAKYTFPLKDFGWADKKQKEPNAWIEADVYPTKAKEENSDVEKDMFYLDRLEAFGVDKEGKEIPKGNFTDPITLDPKALFDTVQKFAKDNNLGKIGKPIKGEVIEKEEPEEEQEGEQEPQERDEYEEDTSVYDATKVSAKLRRIAGSTEIECVAITANCDPNLAMNMLCDVAESDDFSSMITDEPIAIEIVDTGDCLDVAEVDDIDTTAVPKQLFCQLVKTESEITACCQACADLSWLECDLYQLRDAVDHTARMCARLLNVVPLKCACDCCSDDIEFPLAKDKGYLLVADSLQAAIDFIEVYIVNFDASDQDYLNTVVGGLKDLKDYRLRAHEPGTGIINQPLFIQQ